MIPSGPNEHLFTVVLGLAVLNAHGSEPQVIIVSFTSIKPGLNYDDACLISAGSHPFITQDSYIYYREPRIYPSSKIERMVRSNIWREKEPCSEHLPLLSVVI